MKISLVICTRNRAAQLRKCLASLERIDKPSTPVEIVLVDSFSDDDTPEVAAQFAASSSWAVKTVRAPRKGLSVARNHGIDACEGDVVAFSDDDCYLEASYFAKLAAGFGTGQFQYGGGEILLFDAADDPRVAHLRVAHTQVIPPGTPVIPAGVIQGANMFFLREVFDRTGMFDEDLGAGTPFPCEDIDMVCRASHAGFTGVVLAGLTVHHDHGRRRGSPEAQRTVDEYAFGRGAYYAALLSRGVHQAWDLWGSGIPGGATPEPAQLEQLRRELAGAAGFMEVLARRGWSGARRD